MFGALRRLLGIGGSQHVSGFDMQAEGPRGTLNGALPPAVVDGPSGPVSYLSTLKSPQDKQLALNAWEKAASASHPVTALPYDATGMAGSKFNTPMAPNDTPRFQLPSYQGLSMESPDIQSTQNPGFIPLQGSSGVRNIQDQPVPWAPNIRL